ncbi:hypothetical protein L5G32_04215 [Gordonia sp. HY002]|uniref:hypothetical protein n=1 Tax=Gordonia zhenghanii TaxID=2911516 RepID=UPI001EF05B32|nr:hypothetical protein [Gordonia zhenghanii]MCF8569467.1 hypothetical protein [Gordonia zhenghanii]MCF8602362.1 hypothetical protein [Gordonia zhenghanii]
MMFLTVVMIGRAGWWVFVIAQLMAALAMPTSGVSVRYSDAQGVDVIGGSFTDSNALTSISFAALAVTVIAALVHAVIVRRPSVGIVVVAAPVVGGALILWTLDHTTGVDPRVPKIAAFALILLAVATRELVAHFYGSRRTVHQVRKD